MRIIALAATVALVSGSALAGQVTEHARPLLTDIVIQCYRGSSLRPNSDERRIRCEEAKERWRLLPAPDRTAEAEQWMVDLSQAQDETYKAYANPGKGNKQADWSGTKRWDDVLTAISEALRQ